MDIWTLNKEETDRVQTLAEKMLDDRRLTGEERRRFYATAISFALSTLKGKDVGFNHVLLKMEIGELLNAKQTCSLS